MIKKLGKKKLTTMILAGLMSLLTLIGGAALLPTPAKAATADTNTITSADDFKDISEYSRKLFDYAADASGVGEYYTVHTLTAPAEEEPAPEESGIAVAGERIKIKSNVGAIGEDGVTLTTIGAKVGNNLYNPYDGHGFSPEETHSVNGITYTHDGKGRITLNGEVNPGVQHSYIYLFYNRTMLPEGIETGKTYTLSLTPSEGMPYRLQSKYAINEEWGTQNGWGTDESAGDSPTITISEECSGIQIYMQVFEGYVFENFTVEIMINEGEEALPFEEYVPTIDEIKIDPASIVVSYLASASENRGAELDGARIIGSGTDHVKVYFDKDFSAFTALKETEGDYSLSIIKISNTGSSINNGVQASESEDINVAEILGLIALVIIELAGAITYIIKVPNSKYKWIVFAGVIILLSVADVAAYLAFTGII